MAATPGGRGRGRLVSALMRKGLVFDDMEGAVFDPIAEGNRSAHPDALPFRSGDLVPDSLARDLALELSER